MECYTDTYKWFSFIEIMKWVFEIWGSVFDCENQGSWGSIGRFLDFFVILGYESILYFEFKFLNNLINLKNKVYK